MQSVAKAMSLNRASGGHRETHGGVPSKSGLCYVRVMPINRKQSSLTLAGAIALALVLTNSLAACSDTSKPSLAQVARAPNVTPATVEGPITTGALSPPFDPRDMHAEYVGYTEQEFFVSGTATSYVQQGERSPDGYWTVTPGDTAPYKTRIVVRMPADPADFNGIVALEWLNVSAFELAPEWAYLTDSIVDNGVAWIGISVQALSIEGGSSTYIDTGNGTQTDANQGLKTTNPTRYGSLSHPGDEYAFDIYSQVAAALLGDDGPGMLNGARITQLLAVGESQSAAWLTSYLNGIEPITTLFDGYFVHSRFGGAIEYDGSGFDRSVGNLQVGFQIRTDLQVPVFVFETESDVLFSYALARQPDTDLLRVWEVAGTGHSDTYLVGNFKICPVPINDGPQHWVVNAAFTHLLAWVADGTSPPRGEPIESSGTDIHRDDYGIALGGIRTPDVDVPTATLSGAAPEGASQICSILGSTVAFKEETLYSLYPTRQDYLDRYTAALDQAIADGYVRASDREAYLAEANTAVLPD